MGFQGVGHCLLCDKSIENVYAFCPECKLKINKDSPLPRGWKLPLPPGAYLSLAALAEDIKAKGLAKNLSQARKWAGAHIPLEKKYHSEILTYLRSAYPDAFVYKQQAAMYQRGGLPDICCIINGRFFGFEVKRPLIGVVSDLQASAITDIHHAGGVAYVVTSVVEVKAILNEVLKLGD